MKTSFSHLIKELKTIYIALDNDSLINITLSLLSCGRDLSYAIELAKKYSIVHACSIHWVWVRYSKVEIQFFVVLMVWSQIVERQLTVEFSMNLTAKCMVIFFVF